MEKCTATHYSDCLNCKYSDCIRKGSDRNYIEEPNIADFLPLQWINESRVEELDENFNYNYTDYISDN